MGSGTGPGPTVASLPQPPQSHRFFLSLTTRFLTMSLAKMLKAAAKAEGPGEALPVDDASASADRVRAASGPLAAALQPPSLTPSA